MSDLTDDFLPAPEAVSIFEIFSSNKQLEEDGKWFINYFGDRAPGHDVKLRAFSSKASLAVRRRLEAQYRHLMQADGSFPTEVLQKLVTIQLCEAVVMDWRGKLFVEQDGATPLPCTPENVMRLLANSPALRNRFAVSAGDLDQFRSETQDAAAKN